MNFLIFCFLGARPRLLVSNARLYTTSVLKRFQNFDYPKLEMTFVTFLQIILSKTTSLKSSINVSQACLLPKTLDTLDSSKIHIANTCSVNQKSGSNSTLDTSIGF